MTACQDHNIDVFELFPHSSHVSQPLDVNFFRSFNSQLRRVCLFPPLLLTSPQFYPIELENTGSVTTAERREALLRAARSGLVGAATPTAIQTAFKRTGSRNSADVSHAPQGSTRSIPPRFLHIQLLPISTRTTSRPPVLARLCSLGLC
jgi:hypothetical protein